MFNSKTITKWLLKIKPIYMHYISTINKEIKIFLSMFIENIQKISQEKHNFNDFELVL